MSKLSISALAAITIGVGGALAAGLGLESETAYGQTLDEMQLDDVKAHANRVFDRADLDGDKSLTRDEYAALRRAKATLIQLNQFAVIETGAGERLIPLNDLQENRVSFASSISVQKIERLARLRFSAFAGDDELMDRGEFVRSITADFEAVDANGDGALRDRELKRFAGLILRPAPTGV